MRGKLEKTGLDDGFQLKFVSSAATLADDAETKKKETR